jgi:1-acyl-sn-glycerol-3-phosphate acyltransferase
VYDRGVKESDEFESHPRTRLLHGINRLFSRTYHEVEVDAPICVPETGGAVVISNHISALDPLLVQAVVQRPIVWMVAREYCTRQPLKWLFESIKAIPVSRDGKDSGPLRAALRTLSAGHVLGIFPEGRIAKSETILPFQTGAAMIALRAGVPVTPVYQFGSSFGQSMMRSVLIPQKVRLRGGQPIYLRDSVADPRDLDAATEQLQRALESLRHQTVRI